MIVFVRHYRRRPFLTQEKPCIVHVALDVWFIDIPNLIRIRVPSVILNTNRGNKLNCETQQKVFIWLLDWL